MLNATLKSPLKKKIFSGGGGTQTHDIPVTSPPLYHLNNQATDGNGTWMKPVIIDCREFIHAPFPVDFPV